MSVTRHNFRLFEYGAFFVEFQENLPRANSNYTKFVSSATHGISWIRDLCTHIKNKQ